MAAFRDRPLGHTRFPYVFLDATYVKAHEGASVVSKAIVIATGVTERGDREVLGLAVGDSEDGAFWTAFLRNILARIPKGRAEMVLALIRTIWAAPDSAAVREQLDEEVTAFAAFPLAHWRKIWSTNPPGRVNKEIRRRSDVVGIFPNEATVTRLAGAVLLEIHDEWAIAERRYLAEGSIALLDRVANDGRTMEVDGAKSLLLAS